MFGLGSTEALIIAAIVLLLFAPSLLAFWFGFVLGQKRGAEQPEKPPASATPSVAAPSPVPPAAGDISPEEPHDD